MSMLLYQGLISPNRSAISPRWAFRYLSWRMKASNWFHCSCAVTVPPPGAV
jgi:hypothetical protein